MGLPADPTPPSRFVQTYAIKQLSEQPTNFDEAFSLGQKLLNRVDIPLGIMANEFETSDNPEVFLVISPNGALLDITVINHPRSICVLTET